MFENPQYAHYTRDPHRLEIYADFIQKIGGIPQKPASWCNLFFDNGEGLKW
jgi:hypothetical protein